MHPAVKAVVVHCFVLPRKQDTEADVCRPETLSDWRRVPQKQPHTDPRLLFSSLLYLLSSLPHPREPIDDRRVYDWGPSQRQR